MATGGYRLTAVLAFLLVAGTTAAGWQGGRPPGGAASRVVPLPPTGPVAAIGLASPSPRATPDAAAAAAGSPRLSPRARRSCPAAASACVDLSDHLTWLQSDGRVTYGPVRMEPGPPGTPHATPRGTFRVQWKAGANYISTEYDEPMPYAVFFAPGGVAFHGGSLTNASHGCVHLDNGSARYYHDHLPVGAEVVVF
ncbi:MAG: L,D-transpeptidase [Streptosporangiaceae bacterium]